MAQVSFESVGKVYPDGTRALGDFSLDVGDGEFVVFVGPSGCGKTTALRMVAGLEDITSGSVRIGDRVVNKLPPKDRDVAMVFQNYALYPHMTAYDNMAFGLKMRSMPRTEIRRRVGDAARALHPAQLQPEGHVLERAHVRVERVVLEDHRDVAVLRRELVDDLAVDQDAAAADRLEAGDHP